MAQFSHRDVSDALALVHAAAIRDAPSAPFSPALLDGLARLVPGSAVGYHEREIDSHRLMRESGTYGPAPPLDVTLAAATFCGEYPLSIQRHSRETRALKISDFVSCRQLHRLDYYQHALRPMGVEYQIRLWLPAPQAWRATCS